MAEQLVLLRASAAIFHAVLFALSLGVAPPGCVGAGTVSQSHSPRNSFLGRRHTQVADLVPYIRRTNTVVVRLIVAFPTP
jgi:hypothetical protein